MSRKGEPAPVSSRSMAYDEALADRIRHALGEREDVEEKAMFGRQGK